MNTLSFNRLDAALRRIPALRPLLIVLLSCLGWQGAPLHAQITDDGLSIYNEDYFKAITYEWQDNNGVTRVSTLADPATEYRQIVAFLREVYLNPAVPGFTKDKAWQSGLYDETGYENTLVNVPYEPCLAPGNPYGMTAETVVPEPVEGATALLVELVDDYTYDSSASCDNLLRKIKRITLLTHQRYINNTVSANNPGTLFNYVGTLNNFFLVTKGNNRIPRVNEGEDDNKAYGFPPFYNMFEEFSPSNGHPIYGAFATMDAGHGFEVDHNCTSIMTQNHIIVMSPELAQDGSNIDEIRDYAVNFMFFLPDLRFARDTRVHPDPSVTTYEGEWYTYYSADHRPYFFYNKLKAEIGKDPEIIDDNKARVKVSWKSTYNDIVKYEANEDFYIYRVVNDVIQPDPIKDYEMIEPVEYTLNEDGSVTSKSKVNSVYIYEDRGRFAYDVSYIVMGRRYLTDFELTESNIVTNTIPGLVDPPGALNIVIDGERKSKYNISDRHNYYQHTIKMLDSENEIDNVTLAKKHLRGTAEEGIERGTTFRLMRYTDSARDEATEVATLEITNIYKDQWNQYIYDYVIRYADGTEYPAELLPEKCIFKTPVKDTDTETEEALVLAAADAHGVLATFYDNFAADTSLGQHPDMYHYYLDYEAAVLKDTDVTIDYNADSNIIEFLIPHNELKAGYIPYSENQILADGYYDNRLPLNNPGLQFGVTTNPNVETYTIYRVDDSYAAPVKVVKVTRMPTGRLVIERATGTGSTLAYYASVYKSPNPIVEMLPSAALTGSEYILEVKYSNGNTYGNRVAYLYDLPRPVIEDITLEENGPRPNGDNSLYKASVSWHSEGFVAGARTVSATGNADNADRYRHRGYRTWRQRHGADLDADRHYTVVNTVGDSRPDETPTQAPRRTNIADANDPALTITHDEEFTAHEASDTNPVNYDALVRLYTRLPDEMCISEIADPGYVVADATDHRRLTSYRVITSGIDEIDNDTADTDAPVEYYNLRGQPVSNPEPGTIVIRRQGSTVTKLLIP